MGGRDVPVPPGNESSREMLGLKDLQIKEEGQDVLGRGNNVGSGTRPEAIWKNSRGAHRKLEA